ncbi:MAG: S-layer homology domain-containing protein [Clostridia bacterium]|nr:S-layer homology domain-containing protein [Clostridia bacterium]MBP3360087.1 S-layer homology domain-containing protein [Clostridia bacterium]
MKKKIMAFNLAVVTLLGTAAFAQDISVESIEVKGSRVVEIKIAAAPKKEVAIKVKNSTTNEYAFFDELETDADGKASFIFTVPASLASGSYTVGYCLEENSAKSKNFEFADFDGLVVLLDAAADAAGVQSVLSEESGNRFAASVMGIDMTVYEGITNQDDLTAVHNNFLAIKSGTGKEENVNAFNKALGIYSAAGGNAAKALELYNPEFDGQSYSEIADEEARAWIVSVFETAVTDNESFDTAYKNAKILHLVNTANSTEIGGLIFKYGDAIGITSAERYDDFSDLSETNKVKVYDKMVLSLGNAKTKAKICSIFNDAVKDVTAGLKNKDSGNGGGGGSSSSASVVLPSVNAPAVQTQNSAPFTDIADYSWANEAILNLVENKIVSGYEDKTFRPANTVTREEFVKMAVCAIGAVNDGAECDFDDVTEDKWYYIYVASAVENGIISGVDERSFGVGLPVTRQDMAVIVSRCMEFIGKTPAEVKEYEEFADGEIISEYARSSVKKLYTAGLINGMGDGSFAPLDRAARAQAAKVLYDALVK